LIYCAVKLCAVFPVLMPWFQGLLKHDFLLLHPGFSPVIGLITAGIIAHSFALMVACKQAQINFEVFSLKTLKLTELITFVVTSCMC